MKRLFLAVCLCFGLYAMGMAQQSQPSDADAPASKADIERYLDTTHSREMMRKMADAMSEPLHKMVHEQYLKDKDKLPSDFEETTNKTVDDMMKNMPWDEMVDAMIPAYQKHFTQGEMNALIEFYSSPTGQKILSEMPAVAADSIGTMMPIMQKHIAATQEHIQQQIAELTKKSEKGAAETPVQN